MVGGLKAKIIIIPRVVQDEMLYVLVLMKVLSVKWKGDIATASCMDHQRQRFLPVKPAKKGLRC